jgi:hypothetical protein
MNQEKMYRVFTDDVHEYNIEISENEKGYEVYDLIRTGTSWAENAREETVCTMVNDGNGYHISGVDKFMDYAEVLQLQALLQFVSWYESKDSSNSSVVTIESCKEKVRFSI